MTDSKISDTPRLPAYLHSIAYERYLGAFVSGDYPGAKEALISLVDGEFSQDPEERSVVFSFVALVCLFMGDRSEAVRWTEKSELEAPDSPHVKLSAGSFYACATDQMDRGLEKAQEALALLERQGANSEEDRRLVGAAVALRGRCELKSQLFREAHCSLTQLIVLQRGGVLIYDHTVELCGGLISYRESCENAKTYLGFLLEDSKRRGDPDEGPLQQEIEKLLSEA